MWFKTAYQYLAKSSLFELLLIIFVFSLTVALIVIKQYFLGV